MIPLQNPGAAAPAAIFCQRCAKSGAPQAAEAVGEARCCGHLPARRRGAGFRERTLPEEQRQTFALLGCEREAARGGQIGGFPALRKLADHGA